MDWYLSRLEPGSEKDGGEAHPGEHRGLGALQQSAHQSDFLPGSNAFLRAVPPARHSAR